jgi:hypothetical protein
MLNVIEVVDDVRMKRFVVSERSVAMRGKSGALSDGPGRLTMPQRESPRKKGDLERKEPRGD